MIAHACSCGRGDEYFIATRRTADDREVYLWAGGALTQGLGYALPGVPVTRPRTAEAREVAVRAGWLVLGEVELWEISELPALYAAARRVAARGGDPGDLRDAMAALDAPHIPIRWEVLSADATGRPTCRAGYLPRLRWPHLGVWHEGGRYEVMTLGSDGGWRGTGFVFTSQRELMRHLATEGVS